MYEILFYLWFGGFIAMMMMGTTLVHDGESSWVEALMVSGLWFLFLTYAVMSRLFNWKD